METASLSPQASRTTRPGVPHTNFSLMTSLRGPGLRAVDVAPAALPQHNRTLLDTRCHNTMGCRPLTSGGDHLSHKAPHMTSSQTPLTQMSAVPTSKMATKSTLMTSSSTLAKSTMLKIKSFQDLTFRLSGKVLDRVPCTPFDPAPLGLALHEAQREELVSTPVFITAGRKVSPLLGLMFSPRVPEHI